MKTTSETLAKKPMSIEDLLGESDETPTTFDSPSVVSSSNPFSRGTGQKMGADSASIVTGSAPKPLPRCGQAAHILAKFGGAPRLVSIFKALGMPRNRVSVYKWTYPRSKGGTDGIIPTKVWPDLRAAARYAGVLLGPEDFEMRPNFGNQK